MLNLHGTSSTPERHNTCRFSPNKLNLYFDFCVPNLFIIFVTGFPLFFICFYVLNTTQQINRLQITPDKQLLAVAGNHQIKIFEINSTNSTPVCILYFFNYKYHFLAAEYYPQIYMTSSTGFLIRSICFLKS